MVGDGDGADHSRRPGGDAPDLRLLCAHDTDRCDRQPSLRSRGRGRRENRLRDRRPARGDRPPSRRGDRPPDPHQRRLPALRRRPQHPPGPGRARRLHRDPALRGRHRPRLPRAVHRGPGRPRGPPAGPGRGRRSRRRRRLRLRAAHRLLPVPSRRRPRRGAPGRHHPHRAARAPQLLRGARPVLLHLPVHPGGAVRRHPATQPALHPRRVGLALRRGLGQLHGPGAAPS